MNDNYNTTEYYFSIKEDADRPLEGFPLERNMDYRVSFDSGERWHAPLYEFAKLLGAFYGYDITDKISIDGEVLSSVVFSNEQKGALHAALASFSEEDLEEFAEEPSMKKKDKKKKKKNFIMGSADDWADVE